MSDTIDFEVAPELRDARHTNGVQFHGGTIRVGDGRELHAVDLADADGVIHVPPDDEELVAALYCDPAFRAVRKRPSDG